MTNNQTLERARRAFEERTWAESYRLLERADREGTLEPADLERFATAAYLISRDDESEAIWARAHQRYLDRDDRESAARCAVWLAFGLLHRGAMAPASGWFARAEHLLDDASLDCVVRGYLLIPNAIQHVVRGDSETGHAVFAQVAEIARRFGDRDLAALACHGRGRALIRLGKVGEGVARLDEAMAAVLAGDVTPALAGDVYCSVLEGCQETFDVRRAYEWTTSLARWCGSQPELVRFRGECLLYRAEVMQWRGKWNDAVHDAEEARALLMSRPMAGSAFYRLGELHRLRGDHARAEAAYAQANERGRKPQPGLSLLRLAQGQTDAAAASIRGALVDTQVQGPRARVLAAAVDILLAAGDADAARAAAAELSEIARTMSTPLLDATSAHAAGAVQLTGDDLAAASVSLRKAWELWRDLEAPYEEARTCLLLAAVCDRRGDREGRRLEIDAARRLFTELEAASDLAHIDERREDAPRTPGGLLSERESQVLRLLAAGDTNRKIAEALFISEKTVARHVSNIFDKLGVSTRSAATASAYQRNLL